MIKFRNYEKFRNYDIVAIARLSPEHKTTKTKAKKTKWCACSDSHHSISFASLDWSMSAPSSFILALPDFTPAIATAAVNAISEKQTTVITKCMLWNPLLQLDYRHFDFQFLIL